MYVPTVCIVGILSVGSTFFGASDRATLSNASSDSMTSTSLSGLPLPLIASGGSDFDTDGVPDAIEFELGSNPYDLAQPDTLSALSVIWYVDNAGPAARVPLSSGTTMIVYLHNNLETTRTCLIEYYTQEGTYVGATP